MEKIPKGSLFLSVVFIQIKSGRSRVGSATGFFYSVNEKTFLVTNRHVVINEEKQFYPDSLIIRLHRKANLLESFEQELALYDKSSPIWFEHPENFDIHDKSFCNGKIDVVLIEATDLLGGAILASVSEKDIIAPGRALNIGDDCIVVGYPLSFYDDINNLPIVKKASLASAYPVHFKNKPYFLIDGTIRNGMSGSPVFLAPTNLAYHIDKNNELSSGVTLDIVPPQLLGVLSWGIDELELHGVWFHNALNEILTSNLDKK